MPIFTFLNEAGEVLTVVGPTEIKPSVDQCPGAVEVVEGDATLKGAKRAAVAVSLADKTDVEKLQEDVATLKARITATEAKQAATDTKVADLLTTAVPK